MAKQSAVIPVNFEPTSSEPRVVTARAQPPRNESPRYDQGWRRGKPAEDPDKTKRWGRITARPSEYLIHMRRGEIRPRSSGQGASCFKFPWDSVAIIPTTVQRLQFTADQVSRERVGVQITGLAVYRIAQPQVAFRMLNFSFPERASEKLERMLVEMFVGAARRLVANLTVEQCLTQRKEGIAAELMREIAPVVSGHGRIDDSTSQGWGVVLDTIEIQDVRVLSETVFRNMQAPFRDELERRAREHHAQEDALAEGVETEAQRTVELAKLSAQSELGAQQREQQEKSHLAQLATEARIAESTLARKRAEALAEHAAAQERLRLRADAEAAERQAKLEAETDDVRVAAEIDRTRYEADLASAQREKELQRAQTEVAEARLAQAEVDFRLAEIAHRRASLEHERELAHRRGIRDIENQISPEAIQLAVANSLPRLAAAFQQKLGTVHVTAVDGANPFGFVAAAVEGVMGLARAAGLELPEKPKDESH